MMLTANTDALDYIAEGLRPLAVPIETLRGDPKNARKHKEIGRMMESLRTYGQRKPIVVNRLEQNKIEAGNWTWLAAKKLGWTHLAAVFMDDDERVAAGYGIADNRVAEFAEWDTDVLGEVAETVDGLFTGFERAELDDLLGITNVEGGHSTQKPLECMARPIRNHDVSEVYDPFAGSGTTIVACQNLIRKCRAIEISPAYCAVSLERMATAFPGIEIERM